MSKATPPLSWSAAAAGAAVALGVGVLLSRRKKLRVPERLDPTNPKHLAWVRGIKNFLFDIDGVVYTGSGGIEGAAEAIDALRASGRSVRFLTNNSAKTPEMVIKTFNKQGLDARPSEITTSGIAAAEFLLPTAKGKKVYVIGEEPLMAALSDGGMVPFGGPADGGKGKAEITKETLSPAGLVPPANEVAAVVVGADGLINYYKLQKAAMYLQCNPSTMFVVTNPDKQFLLKASSDHGGGMNIPILAPAAGVWMKAIETISGREADMICGKPSTKLGKWLMDTHGYDADATCFVGDRTDTDVEFGRTNGMHTLFVESGTMTAEQAHAAEDIQRPDFIAPSIAMLHECLKAIAKEDAK